ncbi:MAG: peptidylprolyl isomerase, partial [Tenacibaculum sp.]
DEDFKFNNQINQTVADELFAGTKGDVFGPYKDREYFKISKITEVMELPDSAKASHILIPFVGALRATADITRTEEEAKKFADSLLSVVKRRGSKFADLAKEFSSDKGSGAKGGDLDWFNYKRMTPAFRDYVFEGKKGDMNVVKTPFGFHVIRIDNQKNKQKVVKLGTFGRKIEASEATEADIYQNAETFAFELTKGKGFDEVAIESKLTSQPAIGLKVLDENV